MNAYELEATLGLDTKEYDNKLNDAGSKLKNFGSKMGKALGTAAKISAAAVGVAATGVGVLVKKSVDAYAEFEQLEGGVKTIFGDDAGAKVVKNAEKAFATVQMSSNDYLDTVTSFSASLLQSLDGDTNKAVSQADKAIRSMSDNANKMGTDISAIQNAYQGFAKGNFTMLDNLKLGYGGTKGEMERLIEDAEKLDSSFKAVRDENGDLALSFNDIVDAIDIVQDSMGIAGSSASEAATTVEGSMNAMKAAWQNLLTGFGNSDADLDKLINDLISTTETAFKNLEPVIEKALEGIGKFIEKIAPVVAEKLPHVVETVLPSLISAGVSLVSGVIVALPTILQALIDQAPFIVKKIGDALVKAWPDLQEGIEELIYIVAENLPKLLGKILDVVSDVVDDIGKLLGDKFPAFALVFDNLKVVIMGVVGALVSYKAALKIQGAIDNVKKVMEKLKVATEGETIAQKLLNLVMNANPFVLIATVIGTLVAAFMTLWATNENFRNAVKKIWEDVTAAFRAFGDFIVKLFVEDIPGVWNEVINIFEEGIESIVEFFTQFGEAVQETWNAFKEFFVELWEGLKEFFISIWEGIKEFFTETWDNIKEVFSEVVSFFTNVFTGAWDGIQNIWSAVTGFFSDIWSGITGIFSNVASWFSGIFQSAYSAVTGIWDSITGFFSDVWDSIVSIFGDAGVAVGDAISGAVKGAINAVLSGATTIINGFISAINTAISVINAIPGVKISKLEKLSAPALEQGGILKKGQVGILEGNGAEAVVPLDQNKKWTNKVAGDMLTALSKQGLALGGQRGDIIIPVYIGNDRIQELVIKANKINDYKSGGVA